MKLVYSKPLLIEYVVRFVSLGARSLGEETSPGSHRYCGELTVRTTKAYLFNSQNVDKAIKDMFTGAMVVSYKASGEAIG